MSDFLKEPEFRPEENWKEAVDELFKPKEKGRRGGIQLPSPASKGEKEAAMRPTVRIQLPEPAPETTEAAVRYATTEMEHIRQAFLEFQDKIADLGLYPHLFPYIEDFGVICQELGDMIEDNIDVTDLTEEGVLDYQQMRKIRARILSNVWQKYNK